MAVAIHVTSKSLRFAELEGAKPTLIYFIIISTLTPLIVIVSPSSRSPLPYMHINCNTSHTQNRNMHINDGCYQRQK